jgi:hypothetical protein
VFERLPQTVRDEVLNDESFQILADEDMFNADALRYDFGKPVNLLVYLNSKIISAPKHQVIYTIAHEIARYVLRAHKGRSQFCEKDIQDLLVNWGFETEVEAVRYDQAITESDGFKTGYDWAKKQSKDYLMQHFGLYFDEWNERGLGKKPSNVLDKLDLRAEADSIFDHVVPLKNGKRIESNEDIISETVSLRKAMLAGIMVAVNEFKARDVSIH